MKSLFTRLLGKKKKTSADRFEPNPAPFENLSPIVAPGNKEPIALQPEEVFVEASDANTSSHVPESGIEEVIVEKFTDDNIPEVNDTDKEPKETDQQRHDREREEWLSKGN